MIRIGHESEGQRILGRELLLRLAFVGRDAHELDIGFGEFLRGIAKFAGLLGAARRVGFRVEKDHHAFSAQIGKLERAGADVGRAIAGLKRRAGAGSLGFGRMLRFAAWCAISTRDTHARDCKLKGMMTMRKSVIAAGCAAILAAAPLLFGQKGDAAKGKSIFEDNCAVCHDAESADKKIGPGLKGLLKKDKMNNGKKPTEANI